MERTRLGSYKRSQKKCKTCGNTLLVNRETGIYYCPKCGAFDSADSKRRMPDVQTLRLPKSQQTGKVKIYIAKRHKKKTKADVLTEVLR